MYIIYIYTYIYIYIIACICDMQTAYWTDLQCVVCKFRQGLRRHGAVYGYVCMSHVQHMCAHNVSRVWVRVYACCGCNVQHIVCLVCGYVFTRVVGVMSSK